MRVGDKIADLDELKNLVLFDLDMDGLEPIRLSDVADVFVTDNSDEVYARINGNDGIILSFSKQSNYATATVSDNLQERFEELSEKYEGLHFTTMMDQGEYISIIVGSVLAKPADGRGFGRGDFVPLLKELASDGDRGVLHSV